MGTRMAEKYIDTGTLPPCKGMWLVSRVPTMKDVVGSRPALNVTALLQGSYERF